MQLAHNRRVDGVTRAGVLLNLGREDELDIDGLRRLAPSIVRFTDGDGASAPLSDGVGGGQHDDDDGLQVDSSRALGGVWLLDALWRRLGVPDALARVLGPRRFTTDVERVLFAMVANRALDPCSKLACSEWATEDVAIDGLEQIDEDHCYRAMDLLVEADTEGGVQEAVFFACSDLLNLEVDCCSSIPPRRTSSATNPSVICSARTVRYSRRRSASTDTPRTTVPIYPKS